MIETFMVAANEAVARHLDDEGIGLLFRCHPLPDAKKAERFRHQLDTMGIDVAFELPEAAREEAKDEGMTLLDQLRSGGGKLNLFGGGMQVQGGQDGGSADGPEDPADSVAGNGAPGAATGGPQGFAALSQEQQDAWLAPFRAVVQALEEVPEARAEVATLKLLGCMGRAYYTPANEGHFGLASTHYCHFTSPIRRYPDLVVHRNLAWLIEGRDGDAPHAPEDLETLCDHCSDQERAADGLERRVRTACLVLASLHGDDAFGSSSARITGITPASCFVRLESGIEARIPARDLPGGPYGVDEWESMLFLSDIEAPQRVPADDLKAWQIWHDEELGETRRVRACLADRVQVALEGRNVADGKTEARLVSW